MDIPIGFMVVEALTEDGSTHVVRYDSFTPQTAECGAAAGFPVGKGDPSCARCREAMRGQQSL